MGTKERVQDEVQDVDDRMKKLVAFIAENGVFNSLSDIQKGLIVAQAQVMGAYVTILELRLENWSD